MCFAQSTAKKIMSYNPEAPAQSTLSTEHWDLVPALAIAPFTPSGGGDDDDVFGDVITLDVNTWTWQQMKVR